LRGQAESGLIAVSKYFQREKIGSAKGFFNLTKTDITRTKARNEAKYEIMQQFVVSRVIRHWGKNIKESPSSSLAVFGS